MGVAVGGLSLDQDRVGAENKCFALDLASRVPPKKFAAATENPKPSSADALPGLTTANLADDGPDLTRKLMHLRGPQIQKRRSVGKNRDANGPLESTDFNRQ
jgi:hypothetical protein